MLYVVYLNNLFVSFKLFTFDDIYILLRILNG